MEIKCNICGLSLSYCGHLKPNKPKPCGTVAAYRRHLRDKEMPCDKCSRANAQYRAAEKERRQLEPARQLEPCGTRAGYERHRHRGESTCQPCRDAWVEYRRQRKQERQRIREIVLRWLSPRQADEYLAGRWD